MGLSSELRTILVELCHKHGWEAGNLPDNPTVWYLWRRRLQCFLLRMGEGNWKNIIMGDWCLLRKPGDYLYRTPQDVSYLCSLRAARDSVNIAYVGGFPQSLFNEMVRLFDDAATHPEKYAKEFGVDVK